MNKQQVCILLILILPSTLHAQDSIHSRKIDEIIITATKTPRDPFNIPSSIAVINKGEIESYPANNTDDLLHMAAGINVDRDFGLFSKNSSISMRGLNASYRSLILLDGVPINKTDGGSINWNMINPDDIERIEIVKGAGSALYGGNAMSGIVNIITQKPEGKLGGKLKTFYGSCNTFGGALFLNGSMIKNNKGFYWATNAFYRKGDGYITEPLATRDSLFAKTYLKEYSGSIKTGFQFDPNTTFELEYSYYRDKRGDGTRVYEKDGGYNAYPTQAVRGSFHGKLGKISLLMNSFYQLETYKRQVETIKKNTGKYTLYNTLSYKADAGIWTSASIDFSDDQTLTFGADLKHGSVNGQDIYKTSTDILTNKGQINFAAVFAQHEFSAFDDKIRVVAGLRYDLAQFSNGSFVISEPTTLTDFMTSYPTQFSDTIWHSLSPKLAVSYTGIRNMKIYVSYGKGFRAPILDDICRNGNITKGFKQANPKLRPENLQDFEFGHSSLVFNKISLDQSVYLMIGKDFQYFVATGDSIYTGGNNLKPVLQRQNVGTAEIIGTDVNITIPVTKRIIFSSNYAFSHSIIKSYRRPEESDKDLSGKFLMEVPSHMFFASLEWRSRYCSSMILYNYRSKQWTDDENTQQSGIHSTFDWNISAHWKEQYYLSLNVQDLFNHRFVDSKGQLSPGRFCMLSFSYKFNVSSLKQ